MRIHLAFRLLAQWKFWTLPGTWAEGVWTPVGRIHFALFDLFAEGVSLKPPESPSKIKLSATHTFNMDTSAWFLGLPLRGTPLHCRSSFPAPAAWTAWVLREIRLAGSWSDDGSVDSLRPCHFSALPTQGWWELMEKQTHELLVSIDHWWFQPACW